MQRREEFEQAVKTMLEIIGENTQREGLLKTPERVFKAYEYMTQGYAQSPNEVLGEALFKSDNNQMVLIKDIEFYSMCEHHLLPIIGRAHVAYIPDGKVVGLSKIPRMVDIFARRLQIQEQLTEQIAKAIDDVIAPKGVGVVIQARHMCMEMRVCALCGNHGSTFADSNTDALRRTGYITDLCNSPLRLLSLHSKSNRFNSRLCSARCGRRSRIQRLQGRNRFNSRSYGRIYNRLYRYGGHQRNSIQKYARKVPCTA